MELTEQDLKEGLQFIVGTWRPESLINAWSNDLTPIPATEFKSDDGTDFSALTYEFFEDHTMTMKNSATDLAVSGTWEQTDWSEFHYTAGEFLQVPEAMRKPLETLSMRDGKLVFSFGFFAVTLEKIAEGTVTREPTVDEMEMTEEDLKLNAIVGRYETEKMLAMVGGEFGLFTKDEVKADYQKRRSAGEDVDDEEAGTLRFFESITEFTPDHKVVTWMKIPDGVSEEEIRAAVEAGQIGEVKDGYFKGEEKEWKAVNGKYYYNTGEYREIFGEVKSPWDELVPDSEGRIPLEAEVLRRIS